MIELIEYAIRVKGTNKYLPRPQRRDGRGGSHLEPLDFSKPETWPKGYEKNMQIRSYRELRAAKCFLTSWLKGAVGCSRGGDWEESYQDNYRIPKPDRQAHKMEIVEIKILLP